jgi:hypothetical protein
VNSKARCLSCLQEQVGRIEGLQQDIHRLEARLSVWQKQEQAYRAIADVPGIERLTATALVATMGDAAMFKSEREFAAFLGLVTRQAAREASHPPSLTSNAACAGDHGEFHKHQGDRAWFRPSCGVTPARRRSAFGATQRSAQGRALRRRSALNSGRCNRQSRQLQATVTSSLRPENEAT